MSDEKTPLEKAVAALQWLADGADQLEQEAKRLRLEMEALDKKRTAVLESLRQHRAQIQAAGEEVSRAALAGRVVPSTWGTNRSEVNQ